MYTFGQLKADIRDEIFPAGEAINLVKAHNASFVDAIIDIQTVIDCQQQDNTNLFPHCSTLYNCGLTVFDAPRGAIKKLSVIDKINSETGLEDATVSDDWCSEIAYNQVDFCHISTYLRRGQDCASCLPAASFFGLSPDLCGKGWYPTPTDVGVPVSLPALPLGYHYPQSSTNRSYGRSQMGVWAIERGKIYVAPWIQSTETIIVKWDGIKRTWTDADPVDPDPKLKRAVKFYVMKHHSPEFEKEFQDGAYFAREYDMAIADLGHDCREETRVRSCEPSHARNATAISTLYYNDAQSFTAQCADDETGSPVSVTIPAGSMGSFVSVADANQKAKDEAKRQAESRLDCTPEAASFTNDVQQATASCAGEEGAPPPEGSPVTITVLAGEVTSAISKADANTQAQALAQTRAAALLSCTFWNAQQSFTATCPESTVGADVTKTVPPHTYSSVISQAEADSIALNAAKTEAEAALTCAGGPGTFFSTRQFATVTLTNCRNPSTPSAQCIVSVTVGIGPNLATSTVSQADANAIAYNLARQLAQARAAAYCAAHACGVYNIDYPTS